MINLHKRILTAISAVIILVLFLFFLSKVYFFYFISAVLLIGVVEWSRFIFKQNKWLQFIMVLMYVLLLIGLQYIALAWILVAGILASIWLWLAVIFFQFDKGCVAVNLRPVSFIIALFFSTSCVMAIQYLHTNFQQSLWWLCYPVLLTWLVDSAAYFAGKSWGKNPLIVRVSPKKTWEGLIAGIVAGLFFGGIVSLSILPPSFSPLGFLVLTFACIVASVFGDLSISVLKRLANVKDSGSLFPGHGGVLDRVDSLAPVLVVFAAGLYFS